MGDGMAMTQASVMMVPATVADIACVAAQMRPDEIEQWLALTGASNYSADVAAVAAIRAGGPTWALVGTDGRPFLVGGFNMQRPGVAGVWLMGTMAGWARHWRTITKVCRRTIAGLIESDFHRVEVTALASRVAAHRWYQRIGLVHAEPQSAWFASGADAITFAALRGDA